MQVSSSEAPSGSGVDLFLKRWLANPLQIGSAFVLRGAEVIEGGARTLPPLIPALRQGQVGTIICGIPLVLLPVEGLRRFIDAMLAVAPARGFLHTSYCITSPLPPPSTGCGRSGRHGRR